MIPEQEENDILVIFKSSIKYDFANNQILGLSCSRNQIFMKLSIMLIKPITNKNNKFIKQIFLEIKIQKIKISVESKQSFYQSENERKIR